MWQAQFLLAVFCRAENNNLYLKCQVELRPGYLAKWIEINFIPLDNETPDILSYMRQRWLKSTIDNESARRLAEQAIGDPALVEEQRQIEMALRRARGPARGQARMFSP